MRDDSYVRNTWQRRIWDLAATCIQRYMHTTSDWMCIFIQTYPHTYIRLDSHVHDTWQQRAWDVAAKYIQRYTNLFWMCIFIEKYTRTLTRHDSNLHNTWQRRTWDERWGAGVETQKNVRGEIGGWGRVPFNEPYAPSLSTIYDGA